MWRLLLAAALCLVFATGFLDPIGRALVQHDANGSLIFGDLAVYWAGVQAFVSGLDPYDQEVVSKLLAGSGWQSMPIYHPPWVLALLIPLFIYPLYTSVFVWFCASIAALIYVPRIAVAIYGDRVPRWVPIAPALLFLPTFSVVLCGQVALILAACISAAYIHLTKGRDLTAGALLTVVLIKPHLFIPLAVAIAIWIVSNRRWRVLVVPGGVISLIALYAVTHQDVIATWLHGAGSAYSWQTASLSTSLRAVLPQLHQYPVVGVWGPCIVAVAGVLLTWRLWAKESLSIPAIGALLCISVACAPYVWLFDQAVLLLPYSLLWCVLSGTRYPLAGGVAIGAVSVSLIVLRAILPFDYQWTWFAPLLTLLWIAACRWTDGAGRLTREELSVNSPNRAVSMSGSSE